MVALLMAEPLEMPKRAMLSAILYKLQVYFVNKFVLFVVSSTYPNVPLIAPTNVLMVRVVMSGLNGLSNITRKPHNVELDEI